MRILLIEDDAETAGTISAGLQRAHHTVRIAADGPAGLALGVSRAFDILLVDRILPGLDGLGVVRAVRAAGFEGPILILSALAGVEDRVTGLEAGADDYLAKPFAIDELVARVNALGRRTPLREENPVLAAGSLSLDRIRRVVRRGEERVDLQAREIQLLELLMLNAGETVTRTMLLGQIWGFNFDPGTNIVETHISRIRAKIERPGESPLIHTVRGVGYMLRADQA